MINFTKTMQWIFLICSFAISICAFIYGLTFPTLNNSERIAYVVVSSSMFLFDISVVAVLMIEKFKCHKIEK